LISFFILLKHEKCILNCPDLQVDVLCHKGSALATTSDTWRIQKVSFLKLKPPFFTAILPGINPGSILAFIK
jgi:hypothetical protein